jgi:IS30 family transposase
MGNSRTAFRLNAAKERAFRIIPPKLRQTLTVDNGKEFAGHEQLSERLQLPIYFAHAYSSNERATNENTNGLNFPIFRGRGLWVVGNG